MSDPTHTSPDLVAHLREIAHDQDMRPQDTWAWKAAEEIERLRDALRGALILPRPWIAGGVTYAEWAAAFDKITEVLDETA